MTLGNPVETSGNNLVRRMDVYFTPSTIRAEFPDECALLSDAELQIIGTECWHDDSISRVVYEVWSEVVEQALLDAE